MSGTAEEKSVKMAEATVSAAGMRIVRLLVGTPPQTVAQMIRATGVTRTAVTEQLNELVAGGFVERTTERLPGRGRPRHLYSATHAALLLLFASNQRLVVPAVWRAIDKIGSVDLTRKVLEHVSEELADHYRRRISGTTPEERLHEMCQLLEDEGCIVEIDEEEDGQLSIRRRSCPFISMFEESRSVCQVDKRVLSLVVGAPVEQKTCRHDGAPCCTFELVSSNGAS
jgi:predicted ArsR family transcriptional regulator